MSRRRPPCPVTVVVADVHAPPEIPVEAPGGRRYRAAVIFTVDGGRPVGRIQVALDHSLSSAEVRELIAAQGPATGVWPPCEHSRSTSLPRATVVVPTSGERPADLRRCVASLERLDYPDYEVLVVDNRARQGLPPLFEGSSGPPSRVRVLRQPVRGISSAKNQGVESATGEVIAFTDDDVLVDHRWLRALVTPMTADSSIGMVAGLILPRELDTDAQCWYEEYAGLSDRGFEPLAYVPQRRTAGPRRSRAVSVQCKDVLGTVRREIPLFAAAGQGAMGANMAVRSEVIRDVGGFHTALGAGTRAAGGEDYLLCLRVLDSGRTLFYEPAAVVFHRHRRTYPDVVRGIRSWGTGLVAALTALSLEEPRYIPDIVRWAGRSAPRVGRHQPPAGQPRHTHPPLRLRWAELSGMLVGVPAYARARIERRARRVKDLG